LSYQFLESHTDKLTAGGDMSRERGGALSETVTTVSLRTEKMLSMFRLRNKKCSETRPNLFYYCIR